MVTPEDWYAKINKVEAIIRSEVERDLNEMFYPLSELPVYVDERMSKLNLSRIEKTPIEDINEEFVNGL